MRLDTQDQLVAIARFLDDVWRATKPTMGSAGAERMRRAFGLYADAPSEATWSNMVDVLIELVGESAASVMLADLEPYVR